jgi:hypothetical protein
MRSRAKSPRTTSTTSIRTRNSALWKLPSSDDDVDDSVANPNLVVTFSDNESVDGSDIESYRSQDSLPYPSWFMPLSWELRDASDGDEPDDYKPANIYNFDDQTRPLGERIIVMHHPMSMDDIKDHPAYWFLKEIEDFNQNPLNDENRSGWRFSPPRSSTTQRPIALATARAGLSPRTCQTAPLRR